MAELVKVRRLSDEEGQRLLRIVRRGEPKMTRSVIRYRRALVVLASASGNTVPAIARLVAADEDTVREVIHWFNELGMGSLDPRWAGGRPRRISAEDEEFLVATASSRPERLGCPFTHWSLRKLVGYLAENAVRIVRISRERARQLLADHEVTFQRTKTWKESPDPHRETKLTRIEQVLAQCPDRTFAFDEFSAAGLRADARLLLGTGPTPAAGAGQLPQAGRGAAVPRLLLGGRGPAVGRGASPQGRREHPGGVAGDPDAPPRRGPGLRQPGQPVRAQGPDHPLLGGKACRRAVLHPDLRLLGQPDRGALRPAALLRAGQTPPTPITSRSPARCTRICAGATTTPAIPTCSPPNAENAPASAVSTTAAGATAGSRPRHDHTTVIRHPGERSWSQH